MDDEVGLARLKALRSFVSGTGLLDCDATARAEIVEQVAANLPKPPRGLTRWDQFYEALAELFRTDASALAGRALLLNARGELENTETAWPVRRRGRRRRLSAMFLPPLRGGAVTGEPSGVVLPKAVQRRLAFMHDGLDLALDGSSSARRFLLQANLVREHESREILRLLAGAIAEPGEARDPEALRWEALTAMMRLVAMEDTAQGVVEKSTLRCPRGRGGREHRSPISRDGRAPGAAISRRCSTVPAAFRVRLDQHAARSLRPWGDWRVSAHERDIWTSFLKKAGVSDLLRPVPAFAGPSPREWPARLQEALAERSNLPAGQRSKWLELMGNGWAVTNPQTLYAASAVFRLPGQLDFEAIAPVAAMDYGKQLLRLIDVNPSFLKFTISRPLHPQAPNTRSWASPIAAFLHAAKWIPLTDGQLADIRTAWLPGVDGRTPPPLLPLASLEFRQGSLIPRAPPS